MKNNAHNGTNHVPPDVMAGLPPDQSPPDPIDLAGEDSFPASDPPSWTLGAQNRRASAPSPAPGPGGQRPGAPCQVIDFAEARARRRAITSARLQDPVVRIYRPSPSVMQGGKARSRRWVLEFLSSTPPFVEPLMGWTGSKDPRHHVSLSFDSRDEAVAYAKRQGFPFHVSEPHEGRARAPSYANNFMER